tara:strand:- start:22028 stop:22564 length:537 start_codon:yes stop_codon:yes gene_type:complete
MDERLQELLDRLEIQKLLAAYCQGCDRFDAERMAEPFHTDSWIEHGTTKATGREFVDEALPAQFEHTSMVWHQMGQSLIDVKGTEASAETYMLVAVQGPGEDASKLSLMGGRLADTFVKEEGTWKIKTRLQIRDWSYTVTIEDDQMAGAHFASGLPGPKDPGFTALGIPHSGRIRLNE